jgi:hypothetical protein
MRELRRRRWDAIQRSYPPALQKACVDPFDYALKLRTGEIWTFESAKAVSREWVCIVDFHENSGGQKPPFPFVRGVDVRVADIVWVADAPRGS